MGLPEFTGNALDPAYCIETHIVGKPVAVLSAMPASAWRTIEVLDFVARL